MAYLELDRVTVRAAGQVLLQPVSLRVARGGVLTLLGESGSGKSLLAQAIMGNLPATLDCVGIIRIDQHQSRAENQQARHALWGRTLALLPQEPWQALDPTMRIQRQIAETYQLVHPAPPAGGAMAASLRALRGLGLEGAARRYPFQISGGMAQRVAFLATHAAGAPLLIIDEPTKGLDSERRGEVLALLRTAIDGGMTLLTITHDVWLARALGGDVAVMLDGRIVEQGSAGTVLAQPAHAYTGRLLAAEPSAWPAAPFSAPQTAAAVVADISDVAKSFGQQHLFAGVSAQIRRGEFISITGPSGSGKTTFGNVVLGLLKPDQGSVRRGAGLTPTAFQKIYQDPGAAFAPSASLRRSLQDLVALHRLEWDDLLRLLERLRLAPALLDRLPSQVSGGELQRIALARVLMLKPALIFADEPTSRLDPVTQHETLALLAEQAAAFDCAVLLVTHDPDIAARMSQRQIVLGR
jgi:peptide/nickel transport system ATP-binding protein